MIPYVSHNLRAQHAPSPYIKHKIHTFARDSSWWDKPPLFLCEAKRRQCLASSFSCLQQRHSWRNSTCCSSARSPLDRSGQLAIVLYHSPQSCGRMNSLGPMKVWPWQKRLWTTHRLKRPKCPKLAISKGPLSSIAGPQWLPEGVVLHMLSRKCWTCWTVWATWSVSLHSEEGQHSSQHLTPTLPSYLLIQKSLAWEMHFYLRRLLLQTTSGWVARLKKTPFKGKAEEGPI